MLVFGYVAKSPPLHVHLVVSINGARVTSQNAASGAFPVSCNVRCQTRLEAVQYETLFLGTAPASISISSRRGHAP